MGAPKVRWYPTTGHDQPKMHVLVWLWDADYDSATLGFWDGKWKHYSGDGSIVPDYWAPLEWPAKP